MKMKTYIKAVILALSLVVAFTSCDLLGDDSVTPEERLADFTANLNSDSRDSTYQFIHPDATMYNQIKVATWWDATPLSSAYDSFAFTVSLASEAAGVKTYTGSMTNSVATYTAIITFKENGDDIWYIATITLDGTIWIQ